MSKFTKKAGGAASEGSEMVFVRPADLARAGFTGVIAEGEFSEALINPFEETKRDFKIVADSSFSIKGSTANGDEYEKIVSPGDVLVVNGLGNLEYLMKEVSPGALCQISYFGKTEIKKGRQKGKLAHTFEVMYE